MSITELKTAINEKLENLSEKELSNVLSLIKSINENSGVEKKDVGLLFDKVAARYDNVLQKLAQ